MAVGTPLGQFRVFTEFAEQWPDSRNWPSGGPTARVVDYFYCHCLTSNCWNRIKIASQQSGGKQLTSLCFVCLCAAFIIIMLFSTGPGCS